MDIKIEENIPLPTKALGPRGSGTSKYQFDQLNVGMSVFIPGNTDSRGFCSNVRNAAFAYGKRHSKKFTCSITDGGMRVWRTA